MQVCHIFYKSWTPTAINHFFQNQKVKIDHDPSRQPYILSFFHATHSIYIYICCSRPGVGFGRSGFPRRVASALLAVLCTKKNIYVLCSFVVMFYLFFRRASDVDLAHKVRSSSSSFSMLNWNK